MMTKGRLGRFRGEALGLPITRLSALLDSAPDVDQIVGDHAEASQRGMPAKPL
jgi:hypothetical protein